MVPASQETAGAKLALGKLVRVLYLEDERVDVVLAERAMRKSGVPVDLRCVASASEFESALATNHFDLILSDQGVPGFSGKAALEIARERCPNVPFVFLSGADDERNVLMSLQLGATDFISKDSMWRLAIVLRQIADSGKREQELERRLHERTRHLHEANQELEAFSYAVSHDLRAPLQQISGFAVLLAEHQGATLETETQKCIDHIRDGIRRMTAQINDLLRMSKFVRAELKVERVSLSATAHEAALRLKRNEPARQVTFQIEENLEVQGDPGLLHVSVENLLSNAWKFSANVEHALIVFGSILEPEGRTYFVRDNGAGFDMKYADRLFAPFQRLHKDADFAGPGVGLATVRRVVHRHGGRVWAEAEPGKGATFYFTLDSCLSKLMAG